MLNGQIVFFIHFPKFPNDVRQDLTYEIFYLNFEHSCQGSFIFARICRTSLQTLFKLRKANSELQTYYICKKILLYNKLVHDKINTIKKF